MSSGHWQNTGFTKWVNDNLYHYDTSNEKSMNPKKWYDINNGGNLNDTRECIYGFPCRLILVNDGNTALNEGQNEPTPGNTKDMGIFNFNHDKDATDTMGFDQDVFPNCASYEISANSDTSAGAFMSYEGEVGNIGLENGRKTDKIDWKSFGYKSGEEITLESDQKITYLYTFDENMNQGDIITINKKTGSYVLDDALPYFYLYYNGGVTPTYLVINGVKYNYESVEETGIFNLDKSGELDYIKQSFELRFPDEEDVSEDWGFMGIPNEEGTGLKALIDWVDGCSDEEFVNDFEQHFHKDYTLRYYLMVIVAGMVDNLGKNLMLDTWDNKIFMPRFYDCD